MNNKNYFITVTYALFMSVCFSPCLSASQAWQEDLEHYRAQVFEADQSYTTAERAKAQTLLKALENHFDTMSDAEIELALAQVSAVTNNGHSFLMPGGWTHRYARLPISFHVFADGVYIISAQPEFRHLVGYRLESLDGNAVEDFRLAWATYQGGLSGWRELYLPYFLEAPALLHAAGLSRSPDSVALVLSDPSGVLTEAEMPATPDLPPLDGMDQYLAPAKLLVEANGKANQDLPLYLQSPGQAFRFQVMENPSTAYIQFKANVDFSGTQDIDGFLDSVAGELNSLKPRFIVLDQRFNFGGDLNITRSLMQNLPGYLSADGKIFIITSGRTFSAGISSVGYLKQAAGDKAVIIGEPVGDELEFWAEGDLQVLPNSGVAFLMATERHNYRTGCPEDDCHGSIRRNPIRVESLQPEILTPLRYSDYAQGVDPAMEAIRGVIQAGH